jgi:hypothetical protein
VSSGGRGMTCEFRGERDAAGKGEREKGVCWCGCVCVWGGGGLYYGREVLWQAGSRGLECVLIACPLGREAAPKLA